ncbi:ABC transporter [Serratia marcescens]|uniref:ABC transporter n=14 Tax=Serratia TaxID=613 RepID=A0ABX5NFX5_SERMA|nr:MULTISPECIES: sce7726 family protein [Serratia]MBX9288124.1 sce7726 family protein [Serratia marcescens]MBX9353193.1 sce7726 family protein [Serratia marcescens]MDI9108185.1 sce7726 family protein [Serratia marcescens]MDP8712491.1 sce7726 family protein [Serratia marcescens]MDP8781700.1 sce7726 family protein [Serratia marcescens]
MSELLREQDVKIAFIGWLYKKGLLDDATIINEMVVANWSRRADLAVANGHLQAFEIKSDFDSLKRLDGQLEIFTSRFEKVTVVCAPKFTYEVKKKVTPEVGVIEYLHDSKGVRFKIVQRGRTSPIANKKIYISFLLKKELQSLLVESNIKYFSESGRGVLEKIAENISLSKIRLFVLNAIKKRYKETSDSYLQKLNNNNLISIDDLSLLSKSKQKRELCFLDSRQQEVESEDSATYYKLDVERFMKKHGENFCSVPDKVLKRIVK